MKSHVETFIDVIGEELTIDFDILFGDECESNISKEDRRAYLNSVVSIIKAPIEVYIDKEKLETPDSEKYIFEDVRTVKKMFGYYKDEDKNTIALMVKFEYQKEKVLSIGIYYLGAEELENARSGRLIYSDL